MKSKIIVIFIAFLSTISIAQTKVGTINSEYIIRLMPETQIVFKRTQVYGAKLDSLFAIKANEYNTKLKSYKDQEKTLGKLMKKTLLSELATLDNEVKKYRSNGNKLMQLKENELMRPLYKKLNSAITEIVKQDGYTQILINAGNQFAYIDEKFDITKQVLNKLGIKEPEQKKK